MKGRQALLFLAGFVMTLAGADASAQTGGLLTEAKALRLLMIEASTGTTLLSRRPDEPFSPGSLAKLMTVETVLDMLSRGETTLETVFPVSEFAWRNGGAPSRTTTMFAALNSKIPVRDLLSGIVVQNANDACLILAEGLAGSEAAFAQRMNARAASLGLVGSHFENATGLPGAESRVTLRDMIRLSRHVQETYPDFFPLYRQADFEWNRIRQRNKNPLIGATEGVEGFAAGFAEGAGFGIVATARRGETRLFLAMSGLASEKERLDEAVKLIDWGFGDFVHLRAYAAGDRIGEARVYGGTAEVVALAAQNNVDIYVPKADIGKISAEIDYRGPVRAPFEKGQEVGRLKVMVGDTVLQEAPVYTAERVEQGSLASRTRDAVWALLFSWL